jgi:uncharacterized protein
MLAARSGDQREETRVEGKRPGAAVALREMWLGRVWEARPAVVVQDTPEQRMFYIPAGTTIRVAVGPDGREIRLYRDEWSLAVRTSSRAVLSFSWPDRAYGILAFWSGDWAIERWYVNLETPLRPSPAGFDFTDHCLDVLITPDRSTWTWKDQDELAEAVAAGIFSPEEAAQFRRDGEGAVRHLIDREPPFDREWSDWRPDPDWGAPVLPAGWDRG